MTFLITEHNATMIDVHLRMKPNNVWWKFNIPYENRSNTTDYWSESNQNQNQNQDWHGTADQNKEQVQQHYMYVVHVLFLTRTSLTN